MKIDFEDIYLYNISLPVKILFNIVLEFLHTRELPNYIFMKIEIIIMNSDSILTVY